MSTLGSLVVELKADIGSFQASMDRAAHITQQRMQSMDRAVGIARNAFAGLLAGFSVTALASWIKGTIDLADEMNDLSQKVGVTVEHLTELRYAGQTAGVGMESLETGIRKLSVNITNGAEALDRLGIASKDSGGNLRNSYDVLVEIADRFSRMQDGAQKTALAIEIFGRSGADLIPLLNQGAAGLAKLAEEARRAGVVMSTDMAKAADQFNDEMVRLKATVSGVGISIANELLPWLNEMLSEFQRGQKITKSFWESVLVFGTINPFKTVQENIRTLNDDIERLEKKREATSSARARGLVDAEIDRARKQLQFLKETAQDEALKGSGGILDAKDARARGRAAAPFVPAPERVKGGRKGGRDGDDGVLNRQHINAMAEAWEKLGDKRAEALTDPLDVPLNADHIRAMTEAWKQSWKEMDRSATEVLEGLDFEAEDASESMIESMREVGAETAREFGGILASGERTFGRLRDVAGRFLAELVSKGLGKLVGGALGGGDPNLAQDIDLFAAEGRAIGGPVSPRRAYLVGEHGPEMFTPSGAGAVTPNAALGGVTILQNITVDARSDLASVRYAMAVAREQAKADILNSMRRGGVFAR